MNYKQFLLGVCVTIFGLVFRFLLPFHGVEPITGILVCAPQWCTGFMSGAFIVASIMIFDGMTVGLGVWTFGVIAAYCVIVFAFHAMRRQYTTRGSMLMATALMTLVYDALTGLILGPVFFKQPFMEALIGQIPFTFVHVMSNVGLIFGYVVIAHVINGMKTKIEARFGLALQTGESYEAHNA